MKWITVGLISAALSAVLAQNIAAADDPYAALWDTQAAAVSALEAKFTLYEDNKKPREHWLRIDFLTGWFRGARAWMETTPEGKDGAHEQEFGLYEEISWSGRRRPESSGKSFEINSVEKPTYTRDMQMGALRFEPLKWTFSPYHIVLRSKNGVTVQFVNAADSVRFPGAKRLVYRANMGAESCDIVYEVDFTDGIRIHLTEVKMADQIIVSIQNGDFRKCNGIWAAFETVQTGISRPGRVIRLVIGNMSFNQTYQAKDFAPVMNLGDDVINTISGEAYVVKEEIAMPGDFLAPAPKPGAPAAPPKALPGISNGDGKNEVPPATIPSNPPVSSPQSGTPEKAGRLSPTLIFVAVAVLILGGLALVCFARKKRS